MSVYDLTAIDTRAKCSVRWYRYAPQLAQLQLVTLGMGAFPIPASLPVSRVRDSFNSDGTPNDPAYEKRAADFLNEVVWFTEAIANRKAKAK